MTSRRLPQRLARLVFLLVSCLALLAAAAALGAWLWLRASLPQLDGSVPAAGLREPAVLLRDAAGSVTVQARNRNDLAYATGLAHGQDRYFQMDLLRRNSAGELAELLGQAALPLDRRNRPHRFHARARAAYEALPEADRALLQAYAQGVNAGREGLRARPFEYLLLRTEPQPWRPYDTLLVIWSMYFDLQGNEFRRVLGRGLLREMVPPDLLAALTLPASHWDAPLDGRAAPAGLPAVPATRPDWLDQPPPARLSRESSFAPSASVGSNAWAVDGARGQGGLARVANDMHLRLALPAIWYRLVLEYPDGQGGTRRIAGVSLPGAPVVVAGSNGQVAWGFTNSYGRYIDLIELELDPADPLRYRDGLGNWRRAEQQTEMLAVRGGRPEPLALRITHWGPMVQAAGKTYALRWIAHLPDGADLALQRLETAADVPAALDVARRAGVPTQNIVVADRQGRIGWSLAGPLPAEVAQPQGFPLSARQAGGALARLPAQHYPQVIDPPSGRLWTANSLQLGDPAAQARIGDGGADVGVRATQIRDALLAREDWDETALMRLQLDDHARWVHAWRELALGALDDAAVRDRPGRAEFRRLLRQWDGHAGVDQAGYTLARAFYQALYDVWLGPLDRRLQERDPSLALRYASSRLLPLMEALAREQAWRPARFASWQDFLLERIDAVVDEFTRDGRPLAAATWGSHNTLDMAHPLARALPALRPWLSAPAEPMAGDLNVPRTQGPDFGASERMVVAPGHEAQGLLQLPGGASGHPLSPFFLAGHEDWARGRAAPLLPGPAAHRLVLEPARPRP
ncbi:penicillin acylase family protein [Orrella sp. JC864]|uniref:penicillin acylase family protein n=1 Tax=Orrella sp. JC864 TaxID=3120298 RepID=UPI00300A4621